MSVQQHTYITPEEYLSFERQAEYKSEYFDGEVFAMSGASRQHNLIVTNVVAELHRQLKNSACEVYPNDMRVQIPTTPNYFYPDAIVVCEKPQFADNHFDTTQRVGTEHIGIADHDAIGEHHMNALGLKRPDAAIIDRVVEA